MVLNEIIMTDNSNVRRRSRSHVVLIAKLLKRKVVVMQKLGKFGKCLYKSMISEENLKLAFLVIDAIYDCTSSMLFHYFPF